MGFSVGESVGPYQITAYIGQGGMATIYKAHQTTLDRDVAIKVIHPALKDDQAFLQRLNREAAIVAKLNHPNIVTVYDYGEHEGTPFLVMRYIDGRTLKAVLQEKQLDTAHIVTIARSIASALAFAHAHGVLHRDVKPSNILLDAEENVFLTDFGLARLVHSTDSTISRDMLIGSPQYIAPEQAKGEPIDERSDIYSFGIVLYEMFTGRVPFCGDTPYATIMAHINEPLPPARAVNPQIPLAVEMVIEKALAKDPAQRYASVEEMGTALENAAQGPHTQEDPDAVPIVLYPFEPEPAGPPSTSVRRRRRGKGPLDRLPPQALAIGSAVIVAACVLIFCAASLIAVTRQDPLAFLGPATRTATRTMMLTPVQPVTLVPFVVPTAVPSQVPVPSATAIVRAPVPTATAVETLRGKIAYSVAVGELAEQHSIWIANANGTDARKIVEVAIWPSLSPDGRQIAYFRMKGPDGIYVANSDGTNPRQILGFANTCCVQWSPDGKNLLYFRGNLKTGGSIFTANPDGSNIAEIGPGFNPSWSPDSGRIAYTNCQPNSSQCGLYVMDLKTKVSTMITKDNGANPQWSPRGDRIVYQADDGKGHVNVFAVNPDGTGVKQLTAGKSNDGQPVWSRDGNSIYWRSDQNGAGWALFVMRADGTHPRLVINNAPASINWGRESLTTAP